MNGSSWDELAKYLTDHGMVVEGSETLAELKEAYAHLRYGRRRS